MSFELPVKIYKQFLSFIQQNALAYLQTSNNKNANLVVAGNFIPITAKQIHVKCTRGEH